MDARGEVTFDPELAGRRVAADGGAEVPGAGHGVREGFEGTLTGRVLVHGDPPWRWLEISDLTEKPAHVGEETVWCEESYVYLHEPSGSHMDTGPRTPDAHRPG